MIFLSPSLSCSLSAGARCRNLRVQEETLFPPSSPPGPPFLSPFFSPGSLPFSAQLSTSTLRSPATIFSLLLQHRNVSPRTSFCGLQLSLPPPSAQISLPSQLRSPNSDLPPPQLRFPSPHSSYSPPFTAQIPPPPTALSLSLSPAISRFCRSYSF